MVSRRNFLRRSALTGATLAIAGPLQACSGRSGNGPSSSSKSPGALGYGELTEGNELALPKGFQYRIISREGDPMDDGNPTPSRSDGMAAFEGSGGTTILLRNHENKGEAPEVPVVVPDELRYDSDEVAKGGVVKLIVTPERSVSASYAVAGGTMNNCAGGSTPWDSWITCEEVFFDGDAPHGYAFEVDAQAGEPARPVPIIGAGRFVHEAVAWHDGVLYETEDVSGDAAFYRYIPESMPTRAGDLASGAGRLEALALNDEPEADMKQGWAVDEALGVRWVPIQDVDPTQDSLRSEAAEAGAAAFDREEGVWVGNGRIYFDCTEAGDAGLGQIWEYNPADETLRLVYQSPGPEQLKNPDNLVVGPTGDLFVCEDSSSPQFIRGITQEGDIFDFAEALSIDSEFAGACFDPQGRTMFVNQQGEAGKIPAVTYAIWGPW